MKPLRNRLQDAHQQSGIRWDILERDYLLSWLLAGLSRIDSLHDTLIFKGGTALKKCYFGEYRFSEDLDFSGQPSVPTGEALEKAVEQACAAAVNLLDPFAPVEIICQRYTEKEPHPGGQEAFTIRARLPWQRELHTRIMIEISMDEKILKPVQERSIIHHYGEPMEATVQVYALEEVIGEKLRAILQHIEMLSQRGWARSRARDYYDLWRILSAYGSSLDLSDFPTFLKAKCQIRHVTFASPDDFFPDAMLTYVESTWTQWLGPLVSNLPLFGTVIDQLRPQITSLIRST